MTQQQWTAVDDYITDLFIKHDDALNAALRASADAGLPQIAVSPPQGKLLHLLAAAQRARNILEIGTLGGYSAIWLARALPKDGKLITLEADPKHAAVARANIARAGLADIVDLRLGPALDTLPKLSSPFDLIFIDADKQNNPQYFQWALKLSHIGSLIIIDNVVRKAELVDPAVTDAGMTAIRQMNDLIAAESRVTATTIQTVGLKGYDGLTIALVTS